MLETGPEADPGGADAEEAGPVVFVQVEPLQVTRDTVTDEPPPGAAVVVEVCETEVYDEATQTDWPLIVPCVKPAPQGSAGVEPGATGCGLVAPDEETQTGEPFTVPEVSPGGQPIGTAGAEEAPGGAEACAAGVVGEPPNSVILQ